MFSIFPVELPGNFLRYLMHVSGSGVSLHAESRGSEIPVLEEVVVAPTEIKRARKITREEMEAMSVLFFSLFLLFFLEMNFLLL
jgi:hypothetical protein